jgi:protein involved in polysaccharide export with SLBB domain
VGLEYNDTTSIVSRFTVEEDFAEGGAADVVTMEPFDRVDVREAPGFRRQRFVRVTGEFREPGVYAITEGVDRLSDIVGRAGGTLPHAYSGSFMLTRDSLPVAVEYDRVLRGNLEDDLFVRNGDQISIGLDPHTVSVTGAVFRPSIISFMPGRSLEDYIELAGGPTDRGQAHRAVVEYANGMSKRVERHLWLIKSTPEVTSGSVITVPAKPESQASTGDVFARVFQISSTITSLVLTWVAITR